MNEIETWADWRRKYLRSVKPSPHEWEFLRLVLQEVPGLKPSQVTPQKEFIGTDGRTLHMDFGIETPYVKLAIELEGWDKKGIGQGKTKAEHDHFNLRLQSLGAQGWEPLPITNAQFHADPVHYILEISRRIDPRKFEMAPQPIPQQTEVPQHAAAQPIIIQTQGNAANKGLLLAIIGVAVAVLIGVALLIGQNASTQSPSSGVQPPDKDCGDFSSQEEAQAWYEKYFSEFGDYARLDGVGNGPRDNQACASFEY